MSGRPSAPDRDRRPLAAPFFVVRSPLLAWDERRTAAELLDDPITAEALRRASPDLYAAARTAPSEQTTAPLARYAARMRGRATPHSLLAGYSLGAVEGDTTEIALVPRHDYRRVARVSHAWIAELVQATEATLWRRRADALRLPDRLRIVERDVRSGAETATTLQLLPALTRIYERAARPCTYDELVAAAAGDESADELHEQLVAIALDAGLLLRADLPSLRSDDELSALTQHPPAWLPLARATRDTRLGDPADLDALEEHAPASVREPLIVDLIKPAVHARLGRDTLDPLLELVGVLRVVGERTEDRRLRLFAPQFAAVFGRNRAVPLLDAVDPARGLRFPLREDRYDMTPAAVRRWQLRCFERAARSDQRAVDVRDEALPEVERAPLPESFAVSFQLLGEPVRIVDPQVVRAPGTHLFARATALHVDLRERVRGHLRDVAAASPDYDFVDLDCAFDALADISQYPALHASAITLAPSASCAGAIEIGDVQITLRDDDTFELRHARTGRRLLPRPTSSINTDHFQLGPIAQLLFALHQRHVGSLSWGWGPLAHASYTPRVMWGEHRLAAARWCLQPAEVLALRARSRAARRDALQRLRRERGLPRHLQHRQGYDQVLCIDLDSTESVDAWLDGPLGQDVVLAEAAPFARSAVRGPEGGFAHEIVVPLRSAGGLPASPAAATSPLSNLPQAPFGHQLALQLEGDRDELRALLAHLTQTVAGAGRFVFEPCARGVRLFVHATPERLWGNARREQLHQQLQHAVERGVLHDLVVPLHGGAADPLASAFGHASSTHALALNEEQDLSPTSAPSAEQWEALVRYAAAPLVRFAETPAARLNVIEGALATLEPTARASVRRTAGPLHRTLRARLEASVAELVPPPPWDSLVLAVPSERLIALLIEHIRRAWLVGHDDEHLAHIALDLLHRALLTLTRRSPEHPA